MEYTPKKESEEKNLNDVKVEEIEADLLNSSGSSKVFSESEWGEKFEKEETRKKKIVLKLSLARKLLTEKRREILETLSEREFDSITELTEELGRDKKNVSQDIKKLYEHGIIDLRDQGRSKKPVFEFEKIEIEPLEFEGNSSSPGSKELLRKSRVRDMRRKERKLNQGFKEEKRYGTGKDS